MATCEACRKRINPMSSHSIMINQDEYFDVCTECWNEYNKKGMKYFTKEIEVSPELNAKLLREKDRRKEMKEAAKKKEKLLSTMLITTGYSFEGYRIDKYIDIVSSSVVLGTGFLSELGSSISDFFLGGDIKRYV